jgi:multidrug resistance efflux pump
MDSEVPRKIDLRTRRTMLTPVAFADSVMPSLRLVRSSRIIRSVGLCVFLALALFVLLMMFAPWQQSVRGAGDVIAFAPLERQQVVQAPTKGRVRLGEGIFENARVVTGQLIAEIQDLDVDYAGRLENQLANIAKQVDASRLQLQASERALESARLVVRTNEAQVMAYRNVKEETEAAQDAWIEMASQKIRGEEQQLVEYQAAIPQIDAELERMQKLQKNGNISIQKVQEVERKLNESKAKISRAKAYVGQAEQDLKAKQRDREAKVQKAQAEIEYAESVLGKAMIDLSKSEGDVQKAKQDLSKLENEQLKATTEVARQSNQFVTAPFDGFVVQISANLATAILKEGDPLCMIVPDTKDRAVQVWLDGRDAPLVEPGRMVRLQFEGWPAIQFAGWPAVAVGTFGGRVLSVDSTDDGAGRFRILVNPDPLDEPWPEVRFLRQGVRANAWILLDRVPLWFELWRQLNGFAPVVETKSQKEKPSKIPKLPK